MWVAEGSLRHKQVVARGRMIQLAVVQRVDHVLPWVAESLQDLQGFLVYSVGAKVLGHRAVVVVVEPVVSCLSTLCRLWFSEQVFYVEHVDVAYLVHRVRLLLSQQVLVVRLLGDFSRVTAFWIQTVSSVGVLRVFDAHHAQRVKVALLPSEADSHLEVVLVVLHRLEVVGRAQPWVLKNARN